MSWLGHKLFIQTEATRLDKSIRVYSKDNFLGRIHSFFWKDAAFAIANFHFYPDDWSVEKTYSVLLHEARHTKQFRWLGFGIHPIAGIPLAAILYLLFPLPVFFALGRFYMELDADRSRYRFMLENSLTSAQDLINRAKRRAGAMSNSYYCWALLPTLSYKWYVSMAVSVIRDTEKKLNRTFSFNY